METVRGVWRQTEGGRWGVGRHAKRENERGVAAPCFKSLHKKPFTMICTCFRASAATIYKKNIYKNKNKKEIQTKAPSPLVHSNMSDTHVTLKSCQGHQGESDTKIWRPLEVIVLERSQDFSPTVNK